MQANWQSAIERARKHAPFLARGLERLPDLSEMLAAGQGEAALDLAKAAGTNVADTGVALRREKQALGLTLAIGDLAGAFPVSCVMEELSAFADRAMDAAITHAITRRVEDAEPDGFFALALGKHGAGELNYSSDIDPILLYDPDTLPRRARDEPGEAAQRYARNIVRLLSDNTDEGYVFRIDLRLRPASEVSPLAISSAAALSHYESSAVAWERAAFIRARSCAGAVEAGERFLEAIQPFVWRRSLDFGAIDEITRLTARIRSNHEGAARPGPGYNVKLGRGGIREVEFFAQTHQLIHGGRNPALRARGTREALNTLAKACIISAEDAQVLGDSYDRLRVIEHRLQMVEDRQTHSLPEGPDDGGELDSVAQMDGLASGAALVAELAEITDAVAARYDRLLGEDDTGSTQTTESPAPGDTLTARLETLGFDKPEQLAKRITGWSDGRYRALRSNSALRAFEALLPSLLEALAEAPIPGRAIIRWEAVLAAVPSAINLFRLLEARPALLDQLVRILVLAPPLAEELARQPALLDALIDRSALDLPGDVDAVAARMQRPEESGDYERILDRIRIVTGETRFALGVQLIEAAQDPLAIGAALSRTAQAALTVACEAAETEFAGKHGQIAGSELLVIGLGRFGGGALTHSSDLDIIYLFTGDHGAESDGAKPGGRPLGATLYYNRLAQRVTAALSVPTAQGALYEVDTRLRPQGAQGPLAVSVDSFARYQRQDAWTWEHMALTRARILNGSEAAQQQLREVIDSVLHQPREADQLRADVLKMRGDMAAHKPARGDLDAKLSRGGLIDCEFMVHYLQLRERTAFDPDLGPAIKVLVEQGLLGQEMIGAYDLMTRMLVATGLFAPEMVRPPRAAARALAAACNRTGYKTLLHDFTAARQIVAAQWAETFGETLETI